MGPEDILALREGYTVADASNVFDASFQRNPKLIECGCNMHGRRYYVKALDAGDKRAALPLAAYKKLYEIEEEIRHHEPDTKLAVRQAQSKPVSLPRLLSTIRPSSGRFGFGGGAQECARSSQRTIEFCTVRAIADSRLLAGGIALHTPPLFPSAARDCLLR